MKNKLFATSVAATAITPVILFSSLLITQHTFADTVEVGDEGGLQLSITANRRAQPVDNTLAAVTIIDRTTISKFQASSVGDILSRYVPSIDFTTSGGRGKQTSLFLRGGSSKQVLVLIDGVRAGSVSLGTMAWQHLSSDIIESIEVVRGSKSSLYGSEAMSGIISITTRKGQKGKWHGGFSVGSGNTKSASLGTTIGNEKTLLSINTSLLDTDGFDARQGGNTDADGYENKSITLNLQHTFNDKARVVINALQAKGVNEFDGFGSNSGFPNYTPTALDGPKTRGDFLQQNLGLKLKLSPLANLKTELSLGQFKDESVSYDSQISVADGSVATSKSTFDTKRQQIDLKNELSLGNNKTFVFGLDHQRDSAKKSGDDFTKNDRKNTGVYGELSGNVGAHDYQISFRTDDNEAFGRHNTGSVAVGRRFGKNSRLSVSYGTAFKAPTLNELYWPVTPFFQGNPDLKPETSKTFEIGLKTRIANGRFNANIFRSNFKDLLAYQFPTTANINKARIDGLELEYIKKFADVDVNTNLTLLNPRDKTTGKVLAKRVKQTLKINLDRNFGKYGVGASLIAQGKRAASFGSALPGYSTLDLRASYKLNKHWQINVEANNVLDKEYQVTSGFNTSDRNMLLSVNYK